MLSLSGAPIILTLAFGMVSDSSCRVYSIFKNLGFLSSSTIVISRFLSSTSLILPSDLLYFHNAFFSFKDFTYLERGEGLEKERERNINVQKTHGSAASNVPTGDLVRNPGMCPDRESNPRPLDPQASTQSTEPHQSGL